MDAMRDLLNNIRMVDHPVEGGQQGEGEEEEGEDRIDEWDWGTVRLQVCAGRGGGQQDSV